MSAFHASTTGYAWPESTTRAPARSRLRQLRLRLHRPRNLLGWSFVGAGLMVLGLDALVWAFLVP